MRKKIEKISLLLIFLILSGCLTTNEGASEDQAQELAFLRNDVKAKEKELARLREEKKALQDQLDKKIAASEQEISRLESDLSVSGENYRKLLKEKDTLQKQLDAKTQSTDKEIALLKDDIAGKENELARLKNEKDELQRLLAEKTAATDNEIKRLQVENERLNAELKQVRTERDILMGRLEEDTLRTRAVADSLRASLKDYIDKGLIEILQYNSILIVNITDSVMFAPDSPYLEPEYEPVLRILAEAFNKVPDKIIRVEGHTAVSSNSKYKISWVLGAERSISVVRFLQEQCGVDPTRLVVTSHGEYKPVAPNDTKENMRKNRRVTFVLVDKSLYDMDELKKVETGKKKK